MTIVDVPADFAGEFSLAKGNFSFGQFRFVMPGVMAEMKAPMGYTASASTSSAT